MLLQVDLRYKLHTAWSRELFPLYVKCLPYLKHFI
jgi:hypothetical protein